MESSRHQHSIADIQELIRQAEVRLADLKKAANTLSQLDGQAPIYPDTEHKAEATVAAIRRDQWYGQALATAIREYLQMRRASKLGPATVNEIYEALISGGYAFETSDADNAKRGLRISLRKNSAIFHRLPDGIHVGLVDWYPDARTRRQREDDVEGPPERRKTKRVTKTERRPKAKRGRVIVVKRGRVVDSPKPFVSVSPDPSLERAVREAVLAVEGEFTKPDILRWIDLTYPKFGATKRRDSIFTTINRLRGDLGVRTVRKGQGGELSVYARAHTKETNGQHA